MKIVLISKTDFSVIQLNNVSNIAFSGSNIVITYNSTTVTFSTESYYIQILW